RFAKMKKERIYTLFETLSSQEVEWRIKTAFRRSQERKEMNRLKAPKAEKRKTFWDRFKRNS
ncbi:hypothetical protein, partial [Butyricimonas virosa]